MLHKNEQLLKKILNIKELKFTRRGNSAILYALRAAKFLGKQKVIIPDQGGWMTYEQFPERLKLELIRVKTDSGLIDLIELENILKLNQDSVLIVASLAAYAIELPVKKIYELCKKYGVFFINDVSGSIGTELADGKYCDMMLGSFGKYKPINLSEGGFFGYNDSKFYYKEIELVEINYELLNKKILGLDKRLKFLHKKAVDVKKDLEKYDIIYPEHKGINVLVKFHDDKEKRHIIAYCDSRELPYTECPRYIRVKEDAISIEIKRL